MRALVAHRPDPIKPVFTATYGLGWPYHMRLGVTATECERNLVGN